VGQVTSAVYSPRLEQNIALALVAVAHAGIGTKAMIDMSGEPRVCEIVQKPFFDPKKAIAAKG
jgi:aminomethyltransferase